MKAKTKRSSFPVKLVNKKVNNYNIKFCEKTNLKKTSIEN